MIADLHSDVMSANVWGAKAARLGEIARLQIAVVPPAVCITDAVVLQPSSQHAIDSWLSAVRPTRVAVRASSTCEDQRARSGAGRSATVLNTPPDAGAIMRVLRDDVVPRSRTLGGTGSYVVQAQVDAAAAGVAFTTRDDGLLAEASLGSTSAVTSGAQPHLRLEYVRDRLSVTSEPGSHRIPVLLIASHLRRIVSRLRDYFGFDVDVEWGWRDGDLIVLQVRPVTRPLAPQAAA